MGTYDTSRIRDERDASDDSLPYAELVAAEIGVNPLRVLAHYDIRTAWREYLANLRLEPSRRRNLASFESSGPPPF